MQNWKYRNNFNECEYDLETMVSESSMGAGKDEITRTNRPAEDLTTTFRKEIDATNNCRWPRINSAAYQWLMSTFTIQSKFVQITLKILYFLNDYNGWRTTNRAGKRKVHGNHAGIQEGLETQCRIYWQKTTRGCPIVTKLCAVGFCHATMTQLGTRPWSNYVSNACCWRQWNDSEQNYMNDTTFTQYETKENLSALFLIQFHFWFFKKLDEYTILADLRRDVSVESRSFETNVSCKSTARPSTSSGKLRCVFIAQELLEAEGVTWHGTETDDALKRDSTWIIGSATWQ